MCFDGLLVRYRRGRVVVTRIDASCPGRGTSTRCLHGRQLSCHPSQAYGDYGLSPQTIGPRRTTDESHHRLCEGATRAPYDPIREPWPDAAAEGDDVSREGRRSHVVPCHATESEADQESQQSGAPQRRVARHPIRPKPAPNSRPAAAYQYQGPKLRGVAAGYHHQRMWYPTTSQARLSKPNPKPPARAPDILRGDARVKKAASAKINPVRTTSSAGL